MRARPGPFSKPSRLVPRYVRRPRQFFAPHVSPPIRPIYNTCVSIYSTCSGSMLCEPRLGLSSLLLLALALMMLDGRFRFSMECSEGGKLHMSCALASQSDSRAQERERERQNDSRQAPSSLSADFASDPPTPLPALTTSTRPSRAGARPRCPSCAACSRVRGPRTRSSRAGETASTALRASRAPKRRPDLVPRLAAARSRPEETVRKGHHASLSAGTGD